MATYKKYTNKRGEATYYIRAYDGYDTAGKQIERCMKWKPSPGMTDKQIEKELNKQMLAFEDKIKKGLVLDLNTTFSEYADLWMQHAEIAPKTRERYVSLLSRIDSYRNLQGKGRFLSKRGEIMFRNENGCKKTVQYIRR